MRSDGRKNRTRDERHNHHSARHALDRALDWNGKARLISSCELARVQSRPSLARVGRTSRGRSRRMARNGFDVCWCGEWTAWSAAAILIHRTSAIGVPARPESIDVRAGGWDGDGLRCSTEFHLLDPNLGRSPTWFSSRLLGDCGIDGELEALRSSSISDHRLREMSVPASSRKPP